MNALESANDPEEAQVLRRRMVAEQIASRGIREERVLDVLRRIPRHRFLPSGPALLENAYADAAKSIGEGQTISQPFIVALMTEALQLRGDEKILEIGAGSGYQSAVLSCLCRSVIAIERHASLADGAQRILSEIGVTNVEIHVGDGSHGWPSESPYDAILAAAAAPEVPPALIAQLSPGGRLILPLGPERGPQRLILLTKATDSDAFTQRNLGDVGFVPLIGAAGYGLLADLGDVDI